MSVCPAPGSWCRGRAGPTRPAWCRPSTPFCGSLPAPSTPSRRHLFVAWQNVEVKQEKATFWAVVCDLRRPFVGGNGRAGGAGSPYTPRKHVPARPGAELNKLRLKSCSAAGPKGPQRRPKEEELKTATHLVPKAVYGGDGIAVNINVGPGLEGFVPAVWSRKERSGAERREGLAWRTEPSSSSAPPLTAEPGSHPSQQSLHLRLLFLCSSLCFSLTNIKAEWIVFKKYTVSNYTTSNLSCYHDYIIFNVSWKSAVFLFNACFSRV